MTREINDFYFLNVHEIFKKRQALIDAQRISNPIHVNGHNLFVWPGKTRDRPDIQCPERARFNYPQLSGGDHFLGMETCAVQGAPRHDPWLAHRGRNAVLDGRVYTSVMARSTRSRNFAPWRAARASPFRNRSRPVSF
jgi:hypothetical protein